ncbi:MAG: acyl-CoA dehydrogenase family protein [Acidimicrobiales bacterium]
MDDPNDPPHAPDGADSTDPPAPAGRTGIGAEADAWLAANWDPELPLGVWWRRLAESGWGFPHFPTDWFGRGLGPEAEAEVAAAVRRAGAFGPPRGIATMMVAPLLVEMGTEEQKQAWLPGIVTGTDVWCQLFSEPGAGSDLAGLSTRAVLDGDQWVVNGQKVWTSGGHYAQRAILVARTNPDVPKHRGLTFFIIEMDQPGVEPRPLVQMTGDAEFNEVFLTDATVPAGNVIGEVNHGWGVTLRLLSHERGSLDPDAEAGIQHALDLDAPVGRYASGELNDGTRGYMPKAAEAWALLVDLLRRGGLLDDPVRRQQAMEIWSRYEITRYTALRVAAAARAGYQPGPEISLTKLAAVDLMRRWRELALAALGPAGMLAGDDAPEDGLVTQIALSISGMSIAGGTDEIQRNVVGERVLGLPAEARVDKDQPFSAIRRS